MSWPIASDYNDTIQSPETCFSDPDLKGGTVKADRFGLPIASSGMFASVYDVRTQRGRWAVKCFLKPIEDQQRRYAAISTHLKVAALKSTVGFEFLPQGIRVRGQWYPLLKMEWIDGEPLNSYVSKNAGQPHRLLQLTRDWVELMASLRSVGIAHGDLQHGNVLVTPAGIRLIDYDGMYVPALAGCKSHEEGHRNYQHPARTGRDFGPYLDNFSAWVIFSSITAVSLDPRIWQLVNGGDECLLFRREDFERPERSRTFQVLESSRPEVRALAAQFRAMLALSFHHVPALDGKVVSQPIPTPAARPATAASPVPDWLSDHVKATAHVEPPSNEPPPHVEDETATVAAADWIIDHLIDQQAPVPTLQTHSFALERLALLLTLCVATVTGWAATVSVIPTMAGSVLIAVTVGTFAKLLMTRYRRVAGIKERQTTANVLKAAHAVLDQCQAEADAINAERKKLIHPLDVLEAEFRHLPDKINDEVRQVQKKIGEVQGSYGRKRQELGTEEAHALRSLEQDTRRRLAPLQTERNTLDQQERNEMAAALKTLQEAFVESRLANAAIEDASISGIGPKLKARLRAHGIVTARDIEFWQVSRVDGIGAAKANALVEWKNGIVRYTNVPTTLPQDRQFHIRSQFTVRRQRLDHLIQALEEGERSQRQSILDRFAKARWGVDQDERQATATHDAAMQSIHAKLQAERVRLDSEYRALKAKLAPNRRELDAKLGDVNRRTMKQRFEVCKLEKELERFSGLSPRRYLLRIVGIRRAA